MKLSTTLFGTLCALGMIMTLTTSAWAQTADRHSSAKLLPPGDYQCRVGSYAARDCTIERDGDGVALVLPDGLGHFIQFRAELLPSDDKNQMTLLGRLTNPQNICDRCSDDKPDSSECTGTPADRKACIDQPLVARLKVSGGGAKGTLMYYILRPSYQGNQYAGYFKLGNTIDIAITPKKKK